MPSKTILLRSKHEGFAFRAYHAWPEGEVKGGLVLVQEIFGVTDHIRELCDQYAADGYDVIAPSLYDRQERGFEAAYDQAGISQALKLRDAHDMKYSVGDVQACIDWLRDERGQSKVFITGYCYGGTVSWVAAARCAGLDAASAYYGRGIVDFIDEQPSCTMAAPITRSRWIRSSASRRPTRACRSMFTKPATASTPTAAPTTTRRALVSPVNARWRSSQASKPSSAALDRG